MFFWTIESRHKKPWTPEELERAKELLENKTMFSEIAKELGRHPEAVYSKLTHEYEKPRSKVEIITRSCLRCGKNYRARGRFVRLCDNCHDHARSASTAMA